MKFIFLVLFTLILSGCGAQVSSAQLVRANKACENHGGIAGITTFTFVFGDLEREYYVECTDGTAIDIGRLKWQK